METKEILRGIDAFIQKIFCNGDPWQLSDEGISALAKRAEASRNEFFSVANEITNPRTKRIALKAVYELLSTITEVIDTFHNVHLARTKQAYIAQFFKRQKAAERHKELLSCIVAEAETLNRALSKGLKFAQIIRPGVCRRLGVNPEETNWPSASTIKTAITKHKSTPQKSAGKVGS